MEIHYDKEEEEKKNIRNEIFRADNFHKFSLDFEWRFQII